MVARSNMKPEKLTWEINEEQQLPWINQSLGPTYLGSAILTGILGKYAGSVTVYLESVWLNLTMCCYKSHPTYSWKGLTPAYPLTFEKGWSFTAFKLQAFWFCQPEIHCILHCQQGCLGGHNPRWPWMAHPRQLQPKGYNWANFSPGWSLGSLFWGSVALKLWQCECIMTTWYSRIHHWARSVSPSPNSRAILIGIPMGLLSLKIITQYQGLWRRRTTCGPGSNTISIVWKVHVNYYNYLTNSNLASSYSSTPSSYLPS